MLNIILGFFILVETRVGVAITSLFFRVFLCTLAGFSITETKIKIDNPLIADLLDTMYYHIL